MIGFVLAGFLIGFCAATILWLTLAVSREADLETELAAYEQGRKDGWRASQGQLD